MERVSIHEGNKPVIFVAPHVPDDPNTDVLTEVLTDETDGYYVINRGWERGPDVDWANSLANCNNVKHCHEDVVKDEFLDPILRFASRLTKSYETVFVFNIHGVSNHVRKEIGDADLDMIAGWGRGKPNKFTCEKWIQAAFAYHIKKTGLTAYLGGPGSKYAGRAKNNINQLFTRWYPDPYVHTMQLEVVREMRDDKSACELTGGVLAEVIHKLIEEESFDPDSRLPEC